MNKPSDNSLSQQKISGYFPIMRPYKVIVIFLFFGLIYLILGIITLIDYTSLFFVEKYYTYPAHPDDNTNIITSLSFSAKETLKPPIYVHYTLAAFYQNNQRYIDGSDYCSFDLSCSSGTDKEKTLIGMSYFRDSFQIYDSDFNFVTIDDKNLVYDYDRKRDDFSSLNDSEIVWAKIAPLSTFRKLYGVINHELAKGDYTVNITNLYPLPKLTKKAFVIQKISPFFGARNIFVGVVFTAAGGVLILLAVLFLILCILTPRKLGDYHKWGGADFADMRVGMIVESSGNRFDRLPKYLETTDKANESSLQEGSPERALADGGDMLTLTSTSSSSLTSSYSQIHPVSDSSYPETDENGEVLDEVKK